jgi:hypothetical protein
MAVAYDAFSTHAGVPTASGTHTPVGTPAGVLVLVSHLESEAITSVTYNSVSLGAAVATINNTAGGELAVFQFSAYLMGASVPTGAQTVSVTGGASGVRIWVFTVTAGGDVEYVNSTTLESTSVTNPSTTLALSGRDSFVAMAFASGEDATTSNTPLTNWTSRDEVDNGSITVECYSYDIVAATDVTVGVTLSADDILALAVAIAEEVGATVISPNVGSQPLTGRALGLGIGVGFPDQA